MTAARIRVLIVDDHPITRDGIRAGLAHDTSLTVVAEAGDRDTAWLLIQRHRPDVVLVDLRLGGANDGIDLIRRITEQATGTSVLVLSQAAPATVLEAIRAGAHGYLGKASTAAELARAVHAVRVGPLLPPALAALLVAEPRSIRFTAREQDVLRHLAMGYDNREIAEELGIAVRTVNRHLENIRNKVGEHRRSALLRLARKKYPPVSGID